MSTAATHAAWSTLEALEAHPSVVADAADRLLAASASEIDAAAGPVPGRAQPAAAPTVTRPRAPDMRPRARGATGSVIRGSSGVMLSYDELLTFFGDSAKDVLRGSAGSRRRVASVEASATAPRLFGDAVENEKSIAFVIGERARALRASGGSCTPSFAMYDLPTMSTDLRPVRDSLPAFVANRGGIRFQPSPTLSDVSAGVGVWTAANDITPSNPTTKPAVTLTCPGEVEVFVNALTASMVVDNFRHQYHPESADAWLRQLNGAHARLAEQTLIDGMLNDSTVANTETVLGASRDVLAAVDRAASAYRNRQRMASDAYLTFIAPAWLRDLVRTDLSRAAFVSPDELSISYELIDSLFTSRNVSPVWSIDWSPSAPQVDGQLDGWPASCNALLFAPSTFIFLDGGTLNLGVVRDATLISTNNFIVFSESIEAVAKRGTESLHLDMALCANGTTSAPVEIHPCPQRS